MSRKADVLVVGLGAMGASITYQLAKRGIDVIGIDQFAPPHDRGSTHGETRITRQGIGEGLQFVPLALRSHEIWREIEEESDENILTKCGGIIVSRVGQTGSLHGQKDFLRTTIEAANEFNISHEVFDSGAISQHFPQFVLAGDERAYFEPGAGYLNPEKGVAAQLRLATRSGAKIITGYKAVLKQEGRNSFVECGGNEYRAGKIVVSAGAWLPQLVPKLERRLKVSRQVLYWFRLDGTVSYSPDDFSVFIWHWGPGENDHFYGFPQVGDEPVIKIATETFVSTTTPHEINRGVTENEKWEMADRNVLGRLQGVTGECTRATACLYTSTADSNFIIDWLPDRENILIVSACSGHGFKHSPAIGEAVAEMIESGEKPLVLKPFSFD